MDRNTTQDPIVVDLFGGCGSFSLGFRKAGFRPAVAVEWDEHAANTYRANIEGATVLQRDLNGVTSDDILGMLDGKTPSVVISGSPCQGFSTVGKRDPDDPRNSLLAAAGRLAVGLKPRVFVAENVVGVASGAHRRHWEELLGVMTSNGYHAAEIKCDAGDYGVAQVRRRMVLVAWRTRGELAPAAPKKRRRTLAQAIANLNGAMNHEPRRLVAGSHAARIAKHIAPGQKLCNVRAGERAVPTWAIPEVFGRTNEAERVVLIAIRALRRTNRLRDYGDADPVTEATIARHVGRNVADILAALINKGYVRKVTRRYDLTHTFNGKYRRLCWDEPSLTVDTRFGEPRYFLHPDEARGFSVREAARIQGLPDDFTLLGPDREQFRMTGNAIPLQMAVHLGQLARSLVR